MNKAVIDDLKNLATSVAEFAIQPKNIDPNEMLLTFNCGIGMTIILPQQELAKAQDLLQKHECRSWHIGNVVEDKSQSVRYT